MDGENNGKFGDSPIFGLTPICLILSFSLNMLRVFFAAGESFCKLG